MKERLHDKAWLEAELRYKSVRQLAREFAMPVTTLNGYVMRHGIDLHTLRGGKTPGLSQPGHPSAKKIVITKEDILRVYINTNASLGSAAAALGCSLRPLWLAMKEHGIEPKPRGRHRREPGPWVQLRDKAWLAKELEYKTLSQIARELETSNGNVSDHIKRHGLRAESYDRQAAVRDGLDKRYPEGRLGARASHWKGGKTYSSGGHVYIYAPDHPHATKRGYVMEHRLVMEEKLGRLLDPKEHVHHINGDKQDNRPENLEAMTPAEHFQTHFEAVKDVHLLQEHVTTLQRQVLVLEQRLARYAALYGPLPEDPAPPACSHTPPVSSPGPTPMRRLMP